MSKKFVDDREEVQFTNNELQMLVNILDDSEIQSEYGRGVVKSILYKVYDVVVGDAKKTKFTEEEFRVLQYIVDDVRESIEDLNERDSYKILGSIARKIQ